MKPRKGAVKVVRGVLAQRIRKGDTGYIAVAATLISLIVVNHITKHVNNLEAQKLFVSGRKELVVFLGHVRCLFNILPSLVLRHPSGNQKIISAMPYGIGAGYRNCDIGILFAQKEVYVF